MQKWNSNLWLLTEDEFNQLPDGTELIAIDNDKVIKGKDYIDLDTRGGHLAFGVTDINNHPLAELFTTFKLKGN